MNDVNLKFEQVKIRKYFYIIFVSWSVALVIIIGIENLIETGFFFKNGSLLEIINHLKHDGYAINEIIFGIIIWSLGALGILVTMRMLKKEIVQRDILVYSQHKVEEQFKNVWNHSVDGMWIIDSKGIILNVNEAFCEMVGKKSVDLIGKSFSIIYSREHASVRQKILKNSFSSKTVLSVEEKELELWNNHKKWFEISHAFIFDDVTKSDQLLSIFRDIDLRKFYEKELVLLAQTIRSTQDCISITDDDDKIIYINESFEQLYGYTNEELMGKHVSFLRPAITDEVVNNQINEDTKRGKWHGELINKKKDGSEFLIELWTSCVFDKHDQIMALVGVARDITERKRADVILQKSEEKFARVFNSSPDAITISALDTGEYIDVNPGFTKLSGFTREEVLGKTLLEIGIWVDPLERGVFIEKLRNEGSIVNTEITFNKKDKSKVHCLMSAEIISINNRQCLLALNRDVSEWKKLEEERELLIDDLKTAFTNVKTLSGLLPICSSCKKIRDDKGYWSQLEEYIAEHADVEISHGICPECMKKMYPKYANKILK